MAPKKKQQQLVAALSKKEIKKIADNIKLFIQDPTEKNKFLDSLDKTKRAAAIKQFKEEKIKYEKENVSDTNPQSKKAVASTSDAQVPMTQMETLALTGSSKDPDLVKEGAGTSSASQTRVENVEVQDLIIKENTSRNMPASVNATKSLSSGVLLDVNDTALLKRLNEVQHDACPFPLRQNFQSTHTDVFTNRFEVKINSNVVLHEFEIVGIPDKISKRMKKVLVDTAIEHSTVLHSNQDHFATDNVKTIVAWKDFRQDLDNSEAKRVGNGEWHLVHAADGKDGTIPLSLKHVRVLDTEKLQRYVKSDVGDKNWDPLTWYNGSEDAGSDRNTVVNALNTVVSKCLGGDVVRLGPNKFFVESGNEPLGNSPLCTIRGYFYSIRPGMGHILLNVNACTSAFYMPMRLDKLMRHSKDFGRDWPSMLNGLRVYIGYERGQTKTGETTDMNKDESRIKKICGLGRPCGDQTFSLRRKDKNDNALGDQTVYVASYLKEAYGITLERPDLEAVNLGSRSKEMWFAPENLFIMPYQIYSRAVPGIWMGPMHQVACRRPDDNRGLIEGEGMNGLQVNITTRPAHLATFPLTISPTMFRVRSTKIPNPTIAYGNQTFQMAAEAQWNLDKKEFFTTGSSRKAPAVIKYSLLYERKTTANNVDDLRTQFERQMADRGVGRADCRKRTMIQTGDSSDKKASELTFRTALRDARSLGVELVVLVLSHNDQDTYSTFKYLADKIFGLQSIVLVERSNIRQGKWNSGNLNQYIGNVMMKANLKFGGINHTVVSSRNAQAEGDIRKWLKTTLVLGADVTHPGGGALPGCPSIAAVVGSVEQTGGRFLGNLQLQDEANKEIILGSALQGMVYQRVKDWYESNNNTYPENILYYRDGVSDSQYLAVKNNELPFIRTGFNNFHAKLVHQGKADRAQKPPDVNITAVVVTKRHHTRFYPTRKQDMQDGNHNCKPGTLVERGITSPYFTDFYLQSHNGIKGTARPAHYWVLQAEIPMSTSELQHLTHNLCHTYVRATMGVSYASPAYYADRLCERARCYLREYLCPTNALRRDLEARRAMFLRDKGPGPARSRDGQQQQQQQQAGREEVEKMVVELVRGWAERRFDPARGMGKGKGKGKDQGKGKGKAREEEGDGEGDEDFVASQKEREALLRTMYWM